MTSYITVKGRMYKILSWALNFQNPKPKSNPGSSTMDTSMLRHFQCICWQCRTSTFYFLRDSSCFEKETEPCHLQTDFKGMCGGPRCTTQKKLKCLNKNAYSATVGCFILHLNLQINFIIPPSFNDFLLRVYVSYSLGYHLDGSTEEPFWLHLFFQCNQINDKGG